MYFFKYLTKQYISIFFCNFVESPVGPSVQDTVEGNSSSFEGLSPQERQRAIELQQIQIEISAVVNAREITENHLNILEQGFIRILSSVEDISEQELFSPESDFRRLISRISLLQGQLRDLSSEELRLQLLEVQGETTIALQDLMNETIQADVEMTVDDRAELFSQASGELTNMVESIDGLSEEQKNYLLHILENAGGLENISANDIYLLKSIGIDLASLFLVNSEGRARKETMQQGDIYLVNFGGNYSVDRTIGAGDILDMSQCYRVKINGIEGVRGHAPRPGYYTPEGRYLAIHDGYRIEIVEKKEYGEDETSSDFENAQTARIEEFRKEQIDSWMYENVFSSVERSMDIPFVMDVDKNILQRYIQENMADTIEFDSQSNQIRVKAPHASFSAALEEYFSQTGNFEARSNEVLARDPAFLAKLNRVCEQLGVNPEHMLIVMRAESGINPQARNPNGGATGLIQWMPPTARSLGTTTQSLYRMSGIQQLDYVLAYFRPYAGRLNSVEDLYRVTFFPISLGRSPDWVFRSDNLSAETVASANPGIARYSRRPDGAIDGHAFRAYVNAHIAAA